MDNKQTTFLRLILWTVVLVTSLMVPFDSLNAQTPVNRIFAVAWSPDGTILATGGTLNDVHGIWLYDPNGQLITHLNSPDNVISITWSPDGNKIAAYAAKTYYIWDVNTGSVLLSFEQIGATDDSFAYWSPDGSQLATVTGNVVFLRDALTGETVSTLVSPAPRGYSFQSAAWSVDGATLFTAGLDDVVRVWDVTTASVITEFLQPSGVRAMALSPDGTRLAIGHSDRMVQVIDATSGALIDSFQGSFTDVPSGAVRYLRWHPNGNQIASASFDTITVWDLTTDQVVSTYPQIGITLSVPEAMDYSPDGVLAYPGESGSLLIAPIADAGEDQTIFISPSPQGRISPSANVTLDGTGSSDPDGTIVSYDWYQNGVLLGSGPTLTRRFFVGQTTVTLVVTDNDGLTSSDEVVITVTQIQS